MKERTKTIGILAAYCVFTALSGALLSRFLQFASAIPIYLLGLLFIAWRFRFLPAIFACVMSTLTLDYYFTEPRGTLRVGSTQDAAALLSFFAVVVVVSRLSSHLSEKTSRLLSREAAQAALHKLAERCLELDWSSCVAEELCGTVKRCFSLESVSLWDSVESSLSAAGVPPNDDVLRAATLAQRDYDLPGRSIRRMYSGIRPVGTLQLTGCLPDASILGSVTSLVALSLERARSVSAEVAARSERDSEQLRASVLDSLAHSIKTPLTTIALSSAGAIAMGGLDETQKRLLLLVEEQTDRITNLTNSLLSTASLDTEMRVQWQSVDLVEMLASSIAELQPAPARLRLHGLAEGLITKSDPKLLKIALLQVTENALKYSPPHTPIDVSLAQSQNLISISIHNSGSYIPPSEQRLIFTRFYRSPGVAQRAPGTGLGLSIAWRCVEALSGEIKLRSDAASGTVFTIEIPRTGVLHAGIDTDR